MTRWLSPAEMRAWRHSIEGITKVAEAIEAELKESHGLSNPEYSVLVHLSEAPGRQMRMSELATHAVVSKSQLTHLANRMERRGLLTRDPDPDDGRGIVATLTDHGLAAIEAAAPDHLVAVRRHFVDLLTNHEVEVIGEALERVHLRLVQPGHQEPDARAAS